MSPARAAAEARRRLQEMARPAGTFDARRYFRDAGHLGFYNVGTPRVRALARDIFARHRASWSANEGVAFAEILIRDRYLEVKAVGIEVLALYRRDFSPKLLAICRRWLAHGYASNWATTDAICGSLVGPLLVAHPEQAPRVARWCRAGNPWVRRASAVSLIPLVRTGRHLGLAYRVARALHPDSGDLVQKAVGWMLREAGKADLPRLERYLRSHGPRIPRTTLRYAIERFPPSKRRALLTATRERV